MSLVIRCSRCKKELSQMGALVFGPPEQPMHKLHAITAKWHLCVNCYKELVAFIYDKDK